MEERLFYFASWTNHARNHPNKLWMAEKHKFHSEGKARIGELKVNDSGVKNDNSRL